MTNDETDKQAAKESERERKEQHSLVDDEIEEREGVGRRADERIRRQGMDG